MPREIAGIPIQYFGVALACAAERGPATGRRDYGPCHSPRARPGRPACAAPGPRVRTFRSSDSTSPTCCARERSASREGWPNSPTGGVRFSRRLETPFDAVILATGYRAAVGMPRGADSPRRLRISRAPGPSRQRRSIRACTLSGHNYDIRGGLFNISRDARLVAGASRRGAT